jgi:hypothetical protein
MAERPPPAAPPEPAPPPGPPRTPLWFLADRDALRERFVLRTLLRRPGFRAGPWARRDRPGR